MKNLKILYYEGVRETRPASVVTIPFSVLHVGSMLLPRKVSKILEREGILIASCKDLVKEKDLRGTLIEIVDQSEKLVLSVE